MNPEDISNKSKQIAETRRQLREDSEQFPEHMVRLKDSFWQEMEDNPPTMRQLWRSKGYMAQVHEAENGLIRLAITRSDLDKETGRPLNNIPFKTLQRIKNEMGYADYDCTMLFPVDTDWADFGGWATLYVHPYRLGYGERKEPQPENVSRIIIAK